MAISQMTVFFIKMFKLFLDRNS